MSVNYNEQDGLLQDKINSSNVDLNTRANAINAELGGIYTRNDSIDYNSQILQIKADQVDEMQKKLDNYQREISTKGSLVNETEKSLKFQNAAIKSLTMLLYASLFMIFPLMLMLAGRIGPATFIGILLIVIVIFGFIFAWRADLFSIRDFSKQVGSDVTRVFQETNHYDASTKTSIT